MGKIKYCETCKKDTWHKLVRTPMLAFMVIIEKYECEECRRNIIKQFGEYIQKHKQPSDSLLKEQREICAREYDNSNATVYHDILNAPEPTGDKK